MSCILLEKVKDIASEPHEKSIENELRFLVGLECSSLKHGHIIHNFRFLKATYNIAGMRLNMRSNNVI